MDTWLAEWALAAAISNGVLGEDTIAIMTATAEGLGSLHRHGDADTAKPIRHVMTNRMVNLFARCLGGRFS